MNRFDWRALACSTSGNVLPMACMAIIVLAALIGGGVDISRAYMVQNRLQLACDSGVLAGRRAVSTNGYDAAAREQANTYFEANFDLAQGQAVSGTRFVTKADQRGNQVDGVASTRMRTALMNLFGYDELDLTANCVASMSVGNSDVVLVLDTTGSMRNRLSGSSQTRMGALQSAMKNFYDTVAAAKAGSNARVRYGFVPYSSSVNVGKLIYDLNPNYLVDSYRVQSRVFQGYKNVTEQVCDYWGCRNVTRQVPDWRYQQVTNYDYASYKRFSPVTTLTKEANERAVTETSVWEGCIEERGTVAQSSFSFSATSGISPAGAFDLNIDMAPTPSDDRTKWAPMWPEVAYSRGSNTVTSSSGSKASSYCPRAARLLGEMTKSQFDSYANSLTPDGSTYHDLGMIWGARLSSPDGIFASNVTIAPPNGGAVSRHIIFMTDGEMEPSSTIQSSYGIERHDKRVTDNGSSNQAARHTARMRAVCEATKAKGIRVWVIAFAADLTNDLIACASTGSAFTATTASELNKAFQDIAKEVGELRIVQ
mgnify:CR=1 FL=1